jgi:inositol 3-alpha-galactosyltransferase
MTDDSNREQSCWVTLLTRPSYLPGVIVLAHTLDKYQSKYPLVVQYTSSLGEDAILALEAECHAYGRIVPQRVELLLPPKGSENTGSVAERFKDTFTKLRAFELYQQGYTRVVFLDADTAVFQNPDIIFDTHLPGPDWIGANHACVCNLDSDGWAPPEWHKGNCAYTPLQGPDEVAASVNEKVRPTYRLLNGGVFLFHPTQELWMQMLEVFNTSEKVKSYQFPDQDFMADFFQDKWQPFAWKFNALKTMRYWHPRIWSDKDVVVLHYIVDKPWDRHVSEKGVAGHLGRDGITHQWWWDAYTEWKIVREGRGGNELVLQMMDKLVALKEPFTEVIPLPQKPGDLTDVGTCP